MLGKGETPIFILAFFYTAIIVVAGSFCLLLILSSTGIIDFVKREQSSLVSRHCRVYTEQGKTNQYETCVKQAASFK